MRWLGGEVEFVGGLGLLTVCVCMGAAGRGFL